MRSSRPQTQPSARTWRRGRFTGTALLVAFTVATACTQWSFAWMEQGSRGAHDLLREWLALDLDSVRRGQPWQFFTFMFLHAHPFAMVANALVLLFAGREVEPIIGRRHLLSLFLAANVFGGLAQWLALASGVLPADAVLMGVSAGVAGVLAAYATILPELEVSASLFFLLPVRLRAKTLAGLCVLGTMTLGMLQPYAPVGPVAILAGMFVGWIYAKALGFGNPMALERYLIDRRQHAERLRRMPAEQFIREEIDPILEKIARDGTKSLTRAERRTLEMGRQKLARPATANAGPRRAVLASRG